MLQPVGVATPFEAGAPIQPPQASGRWLYPAPADVDPGTTVRIAVTAEDRPGGIGSGEGEKAV